MGECQFENVHARFYLIIISRLLMIYRHERGDKRRQRGGRGDEWGGGSCFVPPGRKMFSTTPCSLLGKTSFFQIKIGIFLPIAVGYVGGRT